MQKRIDFSALARRLLASGYSTYALARELGVSQAAVSRMATGRTRAVSADAAVGLIYLAGGSVTLPSDPAAPGAAVTA
jgi:plasmid maintenance system antidote protein VapI